MKSVEEIKEVLSIQAASMKLIGGFDIEIVKQALNELMEHSIYSDDFLTILYDSTDHYNSELMQTFTKILKFLDCHIPATEQEAKDSILNYYLKQIIEKKEDILEVIRHLKYNLDFDFSDFGEAEPLYEEYYQTTNTEIFSHYLETDEEMIEFKNNLFEIALDCYKKFRENKSSIEDKK